MMMGALTAVSGITSANPPDKQINKGKSHPNVVVIFIDDMGFGDLGFTGAMGYQTPNIDRMLHDGMQFTQFYVAQAVSSASRAGLLTGCYSNRVGIVGALKPKDNIGLNPDETTIAEILKGEGYKTAVFGKWHLGDDEKFLPIHQGFDEYVGLPYSNDMWPNRKDGTPNPNSKTPPLRLLEGDKTIRTLNTLEDLEILTTLYTEKAVDFINRNKANPFFLYVPHNMIHVPLAVSSKFKGKSKLGIYGDVMMEIDWSVGEILKALERNGLDKNTLVVFTSDNGPWLNYGDHGGCTGSMREGKGTAWEGGARVPCVMKWSGVIPEGRHCNQLASTIDLLPTIAEVCNAKLPTHKIDGVSILPLLKGDFDATPREYFTYFYGHDLIGIRNDRFKLVFPHKHRGYADPGMGGFPAKVFNVVQADTCLYDLRRDQGERYNVKHLYKDVVNTLVKQAQISREELGDALTNTQGKGVRKVGTVEP